MFGIPLIIMELKWRRPDGQWGLTGTPLKLGVAGAFCVAIGLIALGHLAGPRLSDEAYHRASEAMAAGEYEKALKEFAKVTAGAHVAEARTKTATAQTKLKEQEQKRKQEEERAQQALAAEQQKAEAEAVESQRKAAEAEKARQRQAAIDFVESCQLLDYDAVARQPEAFTGDPFYFTGKVLQSLQAGVLVIQLAFDEGTAIVQHTRQAGEARILEDDNVTVYGTFIGLKTYTNVLGSEKTAPEFEAKGIQNHGK